MKKWFFLLSGKICRKDFFKLWGLLLESWDLSSELGHPIFHYFRIQDNEKEVSWTTIWSLLFASFFTTIINYILSCQTKHISAIQNIQLFIMPVDWQDDSIVCYEWLHFELSLNRSIYLFYNHLEKCGIK